MCFFTIPYERMESLTNKAAAVELLDVCKVVIKKGTNEILN